MARDYRREYRLFQSSPDKLKYRAELNRINRNNPNSVKGDGKDVSHKGGGTVLEDESVNRGRSGEGGRKRGPRTRRRRAAQGMLVKKAPKMYVEGGVEDVDVTEEKKKGLFKRLFDRFKSKGEGSAPMSTVKSTPEDEPVGDTTMLAPAKVVSQKTMPFLGLFPEPLWVTPGL